MSTYDDSTAQVPYSSLDNPALILRLVAATTIVAAVVGVAFATRDGDSSGGTRQIRGVVDGCDSAACISPRQIVTASDARALKRRLGSHALMVDIASASAIGSGSDVRAAFVESEAPSGMTFRTDFADKVDDALRAAGMGHDEPVILLAPSVEHSVLAALLLQERGYTTVLVVRD